MELISNMPNTWLYGLGISFVLSTLAALVLSQRSRRVVLEHVSHAKRRFSGANTPPRSLSPGTNARISEKEGFARIDPRATTKSSSEKETGTGYERALPPSRRFALPTLAETASPQDKKVLLQNEPTVDTILDNLLPMETSYKSVNGAPKYTPTGFSTAEIEAMGDFPAYDVLTGVPHPQPYANFDAAKALPRPYRPFRWTYHQTMSFKKLEPDWWLEVTKNYISTIEERKQLYQKHGKSVLQYLPGSELACKELMEICLQFYCVRYPTYFSISADKTTFHNNILKSSTNLKSMHPLEVLLNNVPEDFCIVLRNDVDGMYYFRAGVVCSSLGWNVGTKIGKDLQGIHEPIPDYAEKMSKSMDRYFTKLPTDSPIQRGSWGLEEGAPLFMPPGDPHEALRTQQRADLTLEECNLRVDWQTLRRLPLSAGVVFNFTALFTPVTEFRDEPYVPALLHKILTEAKRSLMEYKGTWHVEHVVVPQMEEWAKEQVERGLVKDAWEVETLPEVPFFAGWEDKWKRQQGF